MSLRSLFLCLVRNSFRLRFGLLELRQVVGEAALCCLCLAFIFLDGESLLGLALCCFFSSLNIPSLVFQKVRQGGVLLDKSEPGKDGLSRKPAIRGEGNQVQVQVRCCFIQVNHRCQDIRLPKGLLVPGKDILEVLPELGAVDILRGVSNRLRNPVRGGGDTPGTGRLNPSLCRQVKGTAGRDKQLDIILGAFRVNIRVAMGIVVLSVLPVVTTDCSYLSLLVVRYMIRQLAHNRTSNLPATAGLNPPRV